MRNPSRSPLGYLPLASPVDAVRRYRLIRAVATHTKVSRERLGRLCDLVARVDQDAVAGAIVECGVFRGGAAALMAARTRTPRDVYLFDSFEGLPPPGPLDGAQARQQYRAGWCAGTEQDVRDIFRTVGALGPRVHLVKGWFHDTFQAVRVGPVALLHVDADWYASVRDALDRFWDDLSPGGFLVLDDYGRWEGCTRAADEFLAARGLGPLERTGRAGHFLRKR